MKSTMQAKRAIIIGGGPAGLTAAYELLTRTDIKPIVLEKSEFMGGISRTVNYKGNRIDIGGHRFFSKSDRVMDWWLNILPLQASSNGVTAIRYHRMERCLENSPSGPDPEQTDRVMLVRPRKSRIYYLRRFFDYPISLSVTTLRNLGAWRTIKIGMSYLRSVLSPIRSEKTLEDFFTNRFGRELYRTFFKSYTEKVWGIPCSQISAEWGAQRIKGLSIRKTIQHAISKIIWGSNQKAETASEDISQKNVETSLIEKFLYPKFGPGQMWEEVARQVREMGGEIHTGCVVDRMLTDSGSVYAVDAVKNESGERITIPGDYFFSSAPVQELIRSLDVTPPPNVREVADGLVYRDFITVGLLVKSLRIHEETAEGKKLITDNWIYIQESDVLLGRLQVFNTWSPYMVADPNTVWLGLEYFCNQSDELWNLPDDQMIDLGKKELAKIGIIDEAEVIDATVIRMEKTYPAYFGTYNRFSEIREYVDAIPNLFLVGRNGMHRYNNQDHSMLTAMTAVDCILAGITDKSAIWDVNTETEYHEEKAAAQKAS